MSERSELAQKIANFICENNLAQVFGGDVQKSLNGRGYTVAFSLPRTLDGCVTVYNINYILVQSEGPSGDGNQLFDCLENVLKYLEYRWIKFDRVKADSIPRKPSKKR